MGNYSLIEISLNPVPVPQVLQIVKDPTGWLLQNNDGSVQYAQMITGALPLNQECNAAQWQLLRFDGQLHLVGAQHRLALSITTRALFTPAEYNAGQVKSTYTDRKSTKINGVEKVFMLVEPYTFPYLQGNEVPGWALAQCEWSGAGFMRGPSTNTPPRAMYNFITQDGTTNLYNVLTAE